LGALYLTRGDLKAVPEESKFLLDELGDGDLIFYISLSCGIDFQLPAKRWTIKTISDRPYLFL